MGGKEPPMFYNRYAEEKLASRARQEPRSKSVPKYAKVPQVFNEPRNSCNVDMARATRPPSDDEYMVNNPERRHRRKDRPGKMNEK